MAKRKLKIESMKPDSFVNVRIPRDMKREIARIAKREGVGISTLIRNALWSMVFASK